jgi:hypothetical protein
MAIPTVVDVESASIPIIPATTFGFGVGNQFILDSGPPTFLSTDVGNNLTIIGAVNSDNNGSFPIASFASATDVSVTGTTTSETFPGTATVRIIRASRVSASGVWTLYGANPFSNPTLVANVGDTLIVSGCSNPGNNGSHTITVAANGGNQITTTTTGLVAENFATAISVMIQPAGTISTLPQPITPWALYIKVHAARQIRSSRKQNTDDLERQLAQLTTRAITMTKQRSEGVRQAPITRFRRTWNSYYGG